LSETEGIIPALETAHALGYLRRFDRQLKHKTDVILCLSGRGDKDVGTIKGLI
jgi:tryptophan synthase beta chain